MFRGTLRYSGFSSSLYGLSRLGLLDRRPLLRQETPDDWPNVLNAALERTTGYKINGDLSARSAIMDVLGRDQAEKTTADLEWRVGQSRDTSVTF
jgi:saccharopine dehydrogenase-like NADP-dependent oxidoreductase